MNYLDYIKHVEAPTIIQIGAHDGVLGEEYGLQDYLKSLNTCRVFFVEPIKTYFNNLKNVYEFLGLNAVFCNNAICNTNGPIKMYDAGGLSRVDVNGNCEVSGITWNDFVKSNTIDNIDLLLLDCEGMEFEIMKQINFISKLAPKVIRYEHYHIPNQHDCRSFLISHGYQIGSCVHDSIYNTIAVKI
jgi:FkbM family methyltransferase